MSCAYSARRVALRPRVAANRDSAERARRIDPVDVVPDDRLQILSSSRASAHASSRWLPSSTASRSGGRRQERFLQGATELLGRRAAAAVANLTSDAETARPNASRSSGQSSNEPFSAHTFENAQQFSRARAAICGPMSTAVIACPDRTSL